MNLVKSIHKSLQRISSLKSLTSVYRTLFGKEKGEKIIFAATLLFYVFIWVVNPGNKIVLLSYFVLWLVLFLKFKDFRLSLFLTYLASTIVLTGKEYKIELISPDIYRNIDFYSEGLAAFVVISPKLIFATLMVVVLVRDIIKAKVNLVNIRMKDFLLLGFMSWVLLSNTLGSEWPELSALFSIYRLELVVAYFYLKLSLGKSKNRIIKYFIWLFAALLLFESIISFQQLYTRAPIFKSIETKLDIGNLGVGGDELLFRFRPAGTFPHANELGLWISFSSSMLLLAMIKRFSRVLFFILTAALISLVITLSRSAWIGTAASLLLTLYILEKVKRVKISTRQIFNKRVVGLSIIFLFSILLFVLPRVEKSIYSFRQEEGGGGFRFLQIKETVRVILNHPLLGTGAIMSVQSNLDDNPSGVFSQSPFVVHNWLLLVGVEHGIPAAALFVLFLIVSVKGIWTDIKYCKMNKLKDYLNIGILSGILSAFIIGLLQPFIGDNLIILSLGLLESQKVKL